MPEHRPPRDVHHVQRTQVQYIIDEFARAGTPVQTEPPDWADDRENPAPVKFLYRQDHLLVRDQDLGKILRWPAPRRCPGSARCCALARHAWA
jgi:hypothetical protein